MGKAGCQHPGLACARAGQDEDGSLRHFHGRPLLGVQAREAVRPLGAREVGNAGGGEVGHGRSVSRDSGRKANELQGGDAAGRRQGPSATRGVDAAHQGGQA